MMKTRIAAALLMLMSAGAMAQGKYGATPEDSVTCVQSLSLYGEFYKQKNYADAKKPWLDAMTVCPKSSKNLYIKGVRMYKTFIKENWKDKALREPLIDSLYWIYDQRITAYGEQGKVEGMKGFDMMKYSKSRMAEANELMGHSIELEAEKSNPGVLAGYYQSSYELYKKEELAKEELINRYDPVAILLAGQLKAAIDAGDEKGIDRLKKAIGEVEKIFSVVATCEDLEALYKPKYEEFKEDTLWLAKSVATMAKRDCGESEFYLQMSEQLYSLKPSAVAALGIGIAKLKREQFSEAAKYCKEASELAKDDDLKKKALKYTATSFLALKQYSNVKSYALKWLQLDPNSGEAYMLIGDAYLYGSSSVGENPCEQGWGYIAAVNKYAKAKSLDESLTEKANKKIGQANAQFPKKGDCFFQGHTEGQTVTIGGWINETVTLKVNE